MEFGSHPLTVLWDVVKPPGMREVCTLGHPIPKGPIPPLLPTLAMPPVVVTV